MSKQTRHILVIDDNAEDRAAIRWYLEQDADFAYAIQEAELGSQGIAAYASVRPDCVLLDYRLPDMDGLEVLSVLTEGKIPPDIAIVMFSAARICSTYIAAVIASTNDENSALSFTGSFGFIPITIRYTLLCTKTVYSYAVR